MGVIHTHDFGHPENEPRLAVEQKLRHHVEAWHGVPAPPGDGFRELTAGHLELHDQLSAGSGQAPPAGLHERISLELSHSWPGQANLRFEAPGGAVTMVRVNEADCGVLRRLLAGESS